MCQNGLLSARVKAQTVLNEAKAHLGASLVPGVAVVASIRLAGTGCSLKLHVRKLRPRSVRTGIEPFCKVKYDDITSLGDFRFSRGINLAGKFHSLARLAGTSGRTQRGKIGRVKYSTSFASARRNNGTHSRIKTEIC